MKRYAIALVLMLTAVYVAAEVTTDGLLAAYTFNGTNPWRDVSGHGHDLKIVDPTYAPVVVPDSAMKPNRNKVVYFKPNDRRISPLSATINNLPKGEESRTIVFYLRLPTKGIDGIILSYGKTQNVLSVIDTNTKWADEENQTLSYFLKGYPSSGFSTYTTQKDYVALMRSVFQWTFVVVTYDYIKGIALLSIGGASSTRYSSAKSLVCPSPEALEPLLIGGGTRGFTGYIDDIYIYNRVLTYDELYRNYYNTNNETCLDLAKGTLDIPTMITRTGTDIHPIQKKPILNQTMFTVSGRKAQHTGGITVSKGIAKVLIR